MLAMVWPPSPQPLTLLVTSSEPQSCSLQTAATLQVVFSNVLYMTAAHVQHTSQQQTIPWQKPSLTAVLSSYVENCSPWAQQVLGTKAWHISDEAQLGASDSLRASLTDQGMVSRMVCSARSASTGLRAVRPVLGCLSCCTMRV